MARINAPLLLLVLSCAAAPEADSFSFLRTMPGGLETTHGLHYRISADGLRLVRPIHRTDTFDGHPYEISLGAFIGADEAVLVHAERVADASGASDYSNLPQTDWPTSGFHRRVMCVTLAAEDVAGEHDLEWLRDNGFDPIGSIALEQSLVSSADHNEEVVVSLAVKNVDCSDEAAVAAAFERLRAGVSVQP
jgi:hypothetical protein